MFLNAVKNGKWEKNDVYVTVLGLRFLLRGIGFRTRPNSLEIYVRSETHQNKMYCNLSVSEYTMIILE